MLGLLTLQACQSQAPEIHVTLWAGDSKQSTIDHAQTNEVIKASDPKFDSYVCMTYADLKSIYAVIQSCKNWGNTPMMSAQEAYQRYGWIYEKR